MSAAKMGRPKADPPVQRVIVTLDKASIERARELGAGNLSGGIREAIRRAWLFRSEAEPQEKI